MNGQRGVAFLWMLFLVFLLGLGLGKSLEVYSTTVQREKEADLLYVGDLYRQAIRQFYLSSPGSVRKYPERLEDLLRDPRSLAMRRYLRNLYPDPVSGRAFVPVPSPQGGIWGVRSDAVGKPLKVAGFGDFYQDFEFKGSYRDWVFLYRDGI